jgi:hypothetical protein
VVPEGEGGRRSMSRDEFCDDGDSVHARREKRP